MGRRLAALALLVAALIGVGCSHDDLGPQTEASKPSGGVGQRHPGGVSDEELKTMNPGNAAPTPGAKSA